MANSHGSLEAVDCHLYIVRYDMVLECDGSHPKWASSGRLRRFSDADTSKKSLSRDKDASIL